MARKKAQLHVFHPAFAHLLFILSSNSHGSVYANPEKSKALFSEMLPDTMHYFLDETKADKAISRYCPGLMRCSDISENTNSTQQTVNGDSGHGCCLPCECSQSCFAKGTCCSDLEPSRAEQPALGEYTSDGRTCVDTLIKHIERNHTTMDKLYLLTQTCLEKSKIYTKRNDHTTVSTDDTRSSFSGFVNINGQIIAIDEVINRCLFPSQLDIFDATPVTSLASKKGYRNVFCAFCNNDGISLIDWSMSLNCFSMDGLPKVSDVSNGQQVYSILLNEKLCSINWVPPEELPVDTCFSPKYMISECPTYVPEYLDRLCKDDSNFVPYRGSFAVYRNVVCFVCNINRMGEFLLSPPKKEECSHDQFLNGVIMSFSAVLDLKPLSAAKSEEPVSNNNCEDGLTYNTKLDLCLELMCPNYETKLADRCITVVKQLSGVTLQFQMNFILDNKKQVLPNYRDFTETAENIAISASDGDALDICQSDVIETSIREDTIVVSLYVAKRLSIQSNLPEIYERFQRTIDLYNKEQIGKGEILKVEMRETDIAQFDPHFSTFIAFQGDGFCTQLAAVSKLQICRLVVFQKYVVLDWNFISVGGILFNRTEFFHSNKDSNTQPSIAICEDTYEEKVLSLESIGSSNQSLSNGDEGIIKYKFVLIYVACAWYLFK